MKFITDIDFTNRKIVVTGEDGTPNTFYWDPVKLPLMETLMVVAEFVYNQCAADASDAAKAEFVANWLQSAHWIDGTTVAIGEGRHAGKLGKVIGPGHVPGTLRVRVSGGVGVRSIPTAHLIK